MCCSQIEYASGNHIRTYDCMCSASSSDLIYFTSRKALRSYPGDAGELLFKAL